MRPADEVGPILASRSLATSLRERLEAEVERDGTAVVDFNGVATMSPSFADELIAKLPPEVQQRVKLVNLSSDLRVLIDAVTAGRALAH